MSWFNWISSTEVGDVYDGITIYLRDINIPQVFGIKVWSNSIGLLDPNHPNDTDYIRPVWQVKDGWYTKDKEVKEEVIRRFNVLKLRVDTLKKEADVKYADVKSNNQKEQESFFRRSLGLDENNGE